MAGERSIGSFFRFIDFGAAFQPPLVAAAPEGLGVAGTEFAILPALDGDPHHAGLKLDPVEALLLVAQARRGRGPGLDDERSAGAMNEVLGVVDASAVIVSGENEINRAD